MESIDFRHVFAMLCQSYYLAVMIKAYLELLHLTFWMAVTYPNPNCAHFLQISRSSKQGHQWCLSSVAWGFPPNASSLSSQSLPEKVVQSWPHFFHQTSKPLARSWWNWEVFGGFLVNFWWNLNGTGWKTGRYQHILVSLLCRWTIEVLASSGAACGEWWMARVSIGFVTVSSFPQVRVRT